MGRTGSKTTSNDTGEVSGINEDENANEEDLHMMDELSSTEKVIQCKVSLMEINRKLSIVMRQPL